jgi:UPF0716 family protein affecting phage T7 exclusion
MNGSTSASIAGRGVVAGAAGGIAEIIWILVYTLVTGTDAATLARGVTTAIGANLLFTRGTVASGIAIHMILAVTLGTALAFATPVLRRSVETATHSGHRVHKREGGLVSSRPLSRKK